jgi:hypothetical protein
MMYKAWKGLTPITFLRNLSDLYGLSSLPSPQSIRRFLYEDSDSDTLLNLLDNCNSDYYYLPLPTPLQQRWMCRYVTTDATCASEHQAEIVVLD